MRIDSDFKVGGISRMKPLIVCLAGVFVLLHASMVCSQERKKGWEEPPRQAPKGSIEKPTNMSKVSRHFKVSGTISGPIRHLWLVERIGEQHWPKEPELSPSKGRWQGEVFEGGQPPEGTFEILLMDVSADTAKRFMEWLQTGHRTGSYPGIPVSELGTPTIVDTKTYKLADR
jgi:hypothetical protein